MLFQIWNEFVLKIKLLLLLLTSREARKKAALHCINATIRSLQKFQSCVQIFMTSVIDNVFVKVLIHDKVCN